MLLALWAPLVIVRRPHLWFVRALLVFVVGPTCGCSWAPPFGLLWGPLVVVGGTRLRFVPWLYPFLPFGPLSSISCIFPIPRGCVVKFTQHITMRGTVWYCVCVRCVAAAGSRGCAG